MTTGRINQVSIGQQSARVRDAGFLLIQKRSFLHENRARHEVEIGLRMNLTQTTQQKTHTRPIGSFPTRTDMYVYHRRCAAR